MGIQRFNQRYQNILEGVNDESEILSSFRDKTSNVATKRLANTGQSQNNSELAGLGLVIVGLFAAIKRRKNEEE